MTNSTSHYYEITKADSFHFTSVLMLCGIGPEVFWFSARLDLFSFRICSCFIAFVMGGIHSSPNVESCCFVLNSLKEKGQCQCLPYYVFFYTTNGGRVCLDRVFEHFNILRFDHFNLWSDSYVCIVSQSQKCVFVNLIVR